MNTKLVTKIARRGLWLLIMRVLIISPLIISPLVIMIFSVPGVSAQQAQEPEIITTAPDGYDDLLEPQLTLVDIYFNASLIGSSMASYTLEKISLEQPQQVMAMLTGIKRPEAVLAALSLPLATNQSKVCFYLGQPDCGVLSPELLEVIFDESRLRVDLFINPALLQKQVLALNKYLPESTSGTSMINAISLVASGGEQREDLYTVQLHSIFSYDNYRIISNLESDNQNDTRLDQLSLTYEYRDLAYQLGSFRTLTQSSGFFEQRDFLGFRIQSSLASRTDLEQVSGTRIYLFLNERSRVEVYKEGQLIDSRIYQAGNIELDSRDFPQGSYTVELKIIGDSGRERSESYFYSKSLALPPKDETLFFIEAGFPEDDKTESYPVAKDDALARFGFVTRVTEYFGMSGAIAKNPEQESLELGSFWLGNQIELQTNHAFNGDNDHAAYYQANLRHSDFFLSASYRRTYSEDLPGLDPDLRLIAPNSRQTLVNLGIPFSNSILNIFARSTERQGIDNFRAIGLSWRKNIFRSGRMLLDWTIDASKERNDERLFTGLSLRFLSNRLNVDSRVTRQIRKQNQKTSRHWDKNIRIAYRNPNSELGAVNNSLEFNKTAEQESITNQTELSNDYGYGRLTLEHLKDGSRVANGSAGGSSNNSSSGYSVTSRFNFVSSGGEVVMGGDQQNTAGVMIDVKSIKVKDLDFAVIINKVERTRVRAGASTFIALSPYQTYEVSLVPKGEPLVQFDNTPRQFTLYPGNVESLSWQVDQVRVIIMQLVTDNNTNFANARLRGTNIYARSDDLGWIQIELKRAGELLFVNAEGNECRVTLTENELEDTVNYLGAKHCL